MCVCVCLHLWAFLLFFVVSFLASFSSTDVRIVSCVCVGVCGRVWACVGACVRVHVDL